MNPILINLGFMQIRWYSVLVLSAFVIGYFLVIKQSKNKGYPLTVISDICFYLVIVCILGARLYYCIFNLDYYKENILDIFKIWEGGLAIHGGIIAGIIFLIFYTKKKKLNLLELLDIFVPALALGQAIGRWGNFFNSEAYGSITTLNNLKKLHIPNFIIDGMYINNNYHHPTFLYESIGCLIIFIVLLMLIKTNKTKQGQICGIYFILYGIIRFLIESLRTDSLMLFSFKVAQMASIAMILIGLYLLIKPYIRSKNDKQKMGHSFKR